MVYQPRLSQDEIDALLHEMNGDDVPVIQPENVHTYHFGFQDSVVRRKMQALEIINERFARRLRASLFNFIRRHADISVGRVQIQKYAEFAQNLVVPAHINLMQMSPLHGTGLFIFDPNLVFTVVDNLFGGDGRFQMRDTLREFTQTEQRIIKRLLSCTQDSYVEAWQPIYPIELAFQRAETHSTSSSMVSASEIVVTTSFDLKFGFLSGKLHTCLPYAMLEPIRHILSNPVQNEIIQDQRWAKQLTHHVQSADVELAVDFAEISTTLGELLHFKVGDVLPIERPETVVATVDNIPVMECGYGLSGNNYAVRLEKKIHFQHIDFSKDKQDE